MIFHYTQRKLVIIFSIMLTLFGCSGKSDNTTVQAIPAAVHSKQVKPGAPIKLISAPIISIDSNHPTQVDIELETNDARGYLELDLVPTQGLDLVGTASHQILNLSDAPVIKVSVTLVVHSDGRYYLNMHVRLNNGESSSTRVLALIVQAGAETDKKNQFQKTSGENLISLPAQEKISSQ